MIKEITASGKDIMEAKENARLALGASELDDVTYEILHAGSKGIFGIIGVKQAMVKASMEIPDAEPRRNRRFATAQASSSHDSDKSLRSVKNNGSGNKIVKSKSVNTDETPISSTPSDDQVKTSLTANQASGNSRKRPRNGQRRSPEKARAIFESELSFTKLEPKAGEDRSFDFVKQLVDNLGIEASVELFSCDDGARRINIEGEAASLLIGHHGDTLNALQYLANLASVQKNDNGERDKSRVTINIEGYRAKREESLRILARAKAAQALRTHRNVMLEPMSPYERRIIHSEVQNIEGVSTNSIGTDNNRKVVIYITDKKKGAEKVTSETLEETVMTEEMKEKEVTDTFNETRIDENE